MGVAEELDGLRNDFADCAVVAFADIETQLVLVSSSEVQARRETLDRLCKKAAKTFGQRDVLPIAEADAFITASGDQIEVFLSVPDHPGDALCCVCDPTIPLDTFLAAARTTLDRILAPTEQV